MLRKSARQPSFSRLAKKVLTYNVCMGYYPLFLELTDRPCLVIGGGVVAEGKVAGLLATGAEVTVVAPELTPKLVTLLEDARIKYIRREYAKGDLQGYELCFAATDDGAVNSRVAAEGRQRGVWVNAADDPQYCDFILPSVVRQGDVVVAASTGGSSPALARRLREELTAFLTEDYAPLAELMGEVRDDLKRRNLRVDPETWSKAIDPRVRALVAQRRIEEARHHLLQGLGVAAGRSEA
jgi:precorrin-2 dehydrogenase/sirohydrochlorin ferrochelatase